MTLRTFSNANGLGIRMLKMVFFSRLSDWTLPKLAPINTGDSNGHYFEIQCEWRFLSIKQMNKHTNASKITWKPYTIQHHQPHCQIAFSWFWNVCFRQYFFLLSSEGFIQRAPFEWRFKSRRFPFILKWIAFFVQNQNQSKKRRKTIEWSDSQSTKQSRMERRKFNSMSSLFNLSEFPYAVTIFVLIVFWLHCITRVVLCFLNTFLWWIAQLFI